MPLEQPPPLDDILLGILHARDGQVSDIVLTDGRCLRVVNIAWGYDMGDQYAHVTTNVSPDIVGESIDFFWTQDIGSVVDPQSGAVLFTWPGGKHPRTDS